MDCPNSCDESLTMYCKNKIMNHYRDHPLHNVWKIYAHDKTDKEFTNESYKHCFSMQTIEEFWCFFNNVDDFSRHQFYIMRKNIPPKYECPENRNGGGYSCFIKYSSEVKETLIQVLIRMIGETIVPAQFHDQITGLYLNPKQEGAILKLWFKDFEWLKLNSKKVNLSGIVKLTSHRYTKHKFAGKD